MPTPTVYMWNDVGAPARSEALTDDGDMAYLLKVLNACLVDGYGAKAAAGWTLIGQVTTTNSRAMAFRNATSTGCLRLGAHPSWSYGMDWRSYTAMTDVNTGTNVQQSGTSYTNIPRLSEWCVVADGKTFYLVFKDTSGVVGSLNQYQVQNPDYGLIMAGEYISANPAIIASGQLGNFMTAPTQWDYSFGFYTWDYVRIPMLPTGVANASSQRAGTFCMDVIADWGQNQLMKAPLTIANWVRPPTYNPYGRDANTTRVFGWFRGAKQSFCADQVFWRTMLEAGTIRVGTVMTIDGKNYIPAICPGFTSLYISLQNEDWPA